MKPRQSQRRRWHLYRSRPGSSGSRLRRQVLAPVIASVLTLSLSARSEAALPPIPDYCPVTLPADSRFVPPPPHKDFGPDGGKFWHGTDALFTDLYSDGRWRGISEASGTRNKSAWFRKDAQWLDERPYQLVVTYKRLDADGPMFTVPRVTNAMLGTVAMLIMLELPTQGCWQVTGNYKSDYLTFVVWVD
jgi:hypothetical protein